MEFTLNRLATGSMTLKFPHSRITALLAVVQMCDADARNRIHPVLRYPPKLAVIRWKCLRQQKSLHEYVLDNLSDAHVDIVQQ